MSNCGVFQSNNTLSRGSEQEHPYILRWGGSDAGIVEKTLEVFGVQIGIPKWKYLLYLKTIALCILKDTISSVIPLITYIN